MLYFLLFFQQLSIPFFSQLPLVALLPALVVFSTYFLKGGGGLKFQYTGYGIIGLVTFFALVNVLFFSVGRLSSLAYFFVLYSICFSGILSRNIAEHRRVFLKIGILFAGLGVFQWIWQRLGMPFLDLESFSPSWLVMDGYNFHYPIFYGSSYEKSNGFFCLEPSFFSQFVLLAFLVEFEEKRRWWALGVLVAGYFSSYSGTGALVLIFAAIGVGVSYLQKLDVSRLLFLSVALCFAVLFVYSIVVYFDFDLIRRVGELDSEGSSGSLRFVTPWYWYSKILFSGDLHDFLLGIGPGLTDSLTSTIDANFPAFIKMSIEYGFFSGVAFSIYIASLIGKGASLPLRFALFSFFFLASGALLQPLSVYFVFLMTDLSKGPNR